MNARITAALALAAAAMLAALVTKVMAVSVRAGTLLVCVLIGLALLYVAYRAIGTGKGAHAAPRWYTDGDEPTAVIPRVATEHAPPWDPEPGPVIEPAAFLAAPVAEPPPDAVIIATAKLTDGQLHSVRTAVLPPVLPGALIPPVAALLGYPSVDAAMDALCAGLHSWESNFTKGDARFVRAITDGAS